MHYADPATGQNRTCSDPCPLSTDSSLLYQDFLFENVLSITGIQIKLSEFTGAGPGLHLLQLLSSGAFASAIETNNAASCFAPNPSNITFTGDWAEKVANTDIAGTTQSILVSDVDIGTPASSGPSFTWMPYVSASGQYDINMLIPGCTNFQNCGLRTTVKVTVFPGEGLQPWVTTVPQQNQEDATQLIYSGPILPSSPNFVTTISMTLADSPAGEGQGGQYELVADRVQLVLKSATATSLGTEDGGGSSESKGTIGFGFFEWSRSSASSSSTIDGTKTLPNSTQTSLDNVAFDLFSGLGGSAGLTTSAVTAVVHHSSGTILLGGNFTLSSGAASGSANIIAFKDGVLVALEGNGLNGPVASLVLNGDQVFVGGSFRDTSAGSTRGKLSGIASYNIQTNTWSALGAGVNGQVASLGFANGQVQVAGNFTRLLSSDGDSGIDVAGFAVWDVKTSAWVNSGGFLVGSLSFIGNATSSSQILAGNIVASQRFGASGMVMLKNGGNGGPGVSPLGVQLDSGVSSRNPGPSRRRSHVPRAAAWISHVKLSKLFTRQTTTAQLSPLPPSLPAPAPAVLAGAFWTNSSTSDEVAIIGGNFSFAATGSSLSGSPSQGVAIYDPTSGIVQSLLGSQVNGTVRALLVDGSRLYVGGEFTIQSTTVNGLAIYDLFEQQWDISNLQALQPSPGSTVVVRSITKSSSKTDIIVVAGSFAQAGSLRCQSICSFDSTTKQWNALGNGIQGEVSSVAYAGVSSTALHHYDSC